MSKKGFNLNHGMSGRTQEPLEERPQGPSVEVGDVVVRKAVTLTFDGDTGKTFKGTVVYVHPLGRFHTVEFQFRNGAKARETFAGVER